ncbi:glycosyltransferase [Methylocystis parvus]|uniref:Glycosyltransferase n=1 Tax=Methylocystis parvus TaxID=134 RepID=A0A6B8M710_9HYPH|nr:glycosyltransferase [Methylocystis parvus]QGM98288.1 glycosyltransferase [Methylocystis parvus]WBK01386.1 glycosyltransferase family 4 protein [Methylocystis parvus OBBP]
MDDISQVPASAAPPLGKPLAGKTVAVVHAAWHSCGSYQVNVSQIAAYRALGARVVSVAMMDSLGPAAPEGPKWDDYLNAARNIGANRRYYSGAPTSSIFSPVFLAKAYWRLIHGDQASWLIEIAKRSPLPEDLDGERIDLIHANHFFTLPLVERLKQGKRIPVFLETQDIQARQFILRNQGGFFIPPYAGYSDMLMTELDWMRRADLCTHLNEEEYKDFRNLLPEARHALIYPAVPDVPRAVGVQIVIVASDNYANYKSLRWFLTEVVPKAGGGKVAIYGNIDQGVKKRDPALYEAHAHLFMGRVDNIALVYKRAGCVLLPTVEGHGLSIKAVEALACGAPIIATPLAFRGMNVDPSTLSNVSVAHDAAEFAQFWRKAQARADRGDTPGAMSDTRLLYDRAFSLDAYARALAGALETLRA